MFLTPPYVLKPVDEGSSFGVFIVKEGAARIRRRSWPRDDWAYGE